MKKIATIKLAYAPASYCSRGLDNRWKVKTVTESLEYSPGEYLEKLQVERLIASKNWRVTIS